MNHWRARIQKLGRPAGHSDIGSPVGPASSVRKRRIRLWPTPTETEFARRVWSKALSDNVFGRAEGLAYFFLFSLFPLLIVLTSLLGTVSGGAEIRGELLRYLRTALPPTASRLVESTLAEVSAAGGGGKLSLGIPGAFASAGAGMVAIIEGLNTAYNVREAWPWLKRRAVALVLTLALSLFSLAALGIFYMARSSATSCRITQVWAHSSKSVVHPAVAGRGDAVFAGLSLTYRFAPNVRVQQWRWIFPGAVVASVCGWRPMLVSGSISDSSIPTRPFTDRWWR